MSDRPYPGVLIVLEGIDGAGKTTQAARLAHRLVEAGYPVLLTREPSRGPIGREIRRMADAGAFTDMPQAERNRWFLTDRAWHVAHVLRPALEAGEVVITDRYAWSTFAYSSAFGRHVVQVRADIARWCPDAPAPDLVLFLDLDPEVAIRRLERGRQRLQGTWERFTFLQLVRGGYHITQDAAIDRARTHLRVVEASLAEDALADWIGGVVDAFLGDQHVRRAA